MPMLTEPRRNLLATLNGVKGGWVWGREITVPARRLASQMARDGLVEWRSVVGVSTRHEVKNQKLYITAAGRAALAQQ
jgi:hypothetical protein